jgi:hypothetical protein
MLTISFTALIDGQGVVLWYAGHLGQLALICLAIEELCISSFRWYSCFSLPIMRVVLLLVLLVLMSITPPTLAVTTATTTVVSSSSLPSSSSSSSGSECDPSYPQLCIPPPPPKLTCDDISARKFTVEKPDPHNLDGDANGIACEVPPPPQPTSPEELQQRHEQALLSGNQTAVGGNGTSTTGNATTTSTTTTNATDATTPNATSGPNTTPPLRSNSSDGPFIQFKGRLGNGTGTQNNNTSVIPVTSAPPANNATTTTTTPVTKTNTFLTATINGSRFANNDTIAINGTVGGHAIPSNTGKLYVEVRDPHNETVMYDSTNMTTVGNSKSPFSYKFVVGELDADNSTTNSATTTANPSRTVLKPMNESGLNYTMTVGYRMLGTSPSEVGFVFAYDPDGTAGGGLLGADGGPTTVASQFAGNNTTTTTTTTTTQEPVIPPRPVLDESDDDDSSSSSSDDNDDDDNVDSGGDNGDDDNGNDDEDDDDNDDSTDALEILKEVLNREPPEDDDED